MSGPRVIYLAGFGRSGSTLAERLLGQLPGACPAGELVHMWRRGIGEDELCGCGAQFTRCPFWCEVGQAAFGGWEKADIGRLAQLRHRVDRTRFVPLLAAPGLMRPALRRALDEYAGYYQRVYAAIGEVSGCQAVIDSSKHASLAFCLSRSRRIDLRVVHMVRDSRAVAYSWTKRVSRPDAPPGSYMRTYSPMAAAAQWDIQNGALHLLPRTGTPTLRVRYEDLTAAPEESLRRIAAFAGLPAGRRELAFLGSDGARTWADVSVAHTASGNPMRFSTGRVEIRGDDAWRGALPRRDRAVVSALTLPWLARYGYLREAPGQA